MNAAEVSRFGVRYGDALAALLIALPWLWPITWGPTVAVVPWLVSAGCAAVLLVLLRREALAEVAAAGWLAAALVSAVFGLMQFTQTAYLAAPFVNGSLPGEVFANLRQRNQFASLMSIGLLALLWLPQAGRWPAGRAGAALAAGVAALLATGTALSVSRTGLFQLLMVLVFALAWRVPRLAAVRATLWTVVPAYVGVTLLLAAGVGPSAGPGITERLTEGVAPCSSRLALWSNVLQLIRIRPWLGWGWGELDYAHFVTLFDGTRFCDILDNAHNLPLHLAVELGLPLALLICIGFGVWVARRRPWAERDPARQMAWGVVAVIGLHSLLEYPLWYGPFQMAFGLCLWLLWPLEAQTGRSGRPSEPVPPWRGVLGGVLLVAAGYAGWDYFRVGQIYLPVEERAAPYRTDTLAQARDTLLFADQVRFAELSTTPLTRESAGWTYRTARELLHYSPEPRVIERAVESAAMLGLDDEAAGLLDRYRAAFPREYARWSEANRTAPPQPAP